MELSDATIGELLERWWEGYPQHVYDYADEYGEPGYGSHRTTRVVLGDYWCRCDKFGTDQYGSKLHGISDHHPRVWRAMEDAGVEFEWYDEWMVDHETYPSKAYRTQPDSYMWQPSVILTDDCEWLTPDSDITEWVEWAVNTPSRALYRRHLDQLVDAGFTRWPDEDAWYENGWHPGQTDDPKQITEQIRADYPDHDIVFVITDTGQFDIRFAAYIREEEQ
jgi:hypothetical protein